MSVESIVTPADKILVTGSNGFIGTRAVENLLSRGFFNLRLFVRPSSKLEKLQKILAQFPAAKNVEIVAGDLLSREDCQRAAKDVAVIVHLAAGFDKSFAGAFMNSALATRNLLDAFLELGKPRRFVNVSSFAVYSNYKMERHALLDENCPLETEPQARNDAYGFGKLKQEQLVQEYGRTRGLKWVILRPGMVYGPGKSELSGRVGINTFGFFIHMGGRNEMPMTYVDNTADAVILAAIKPGVDGEIFNVVDDERWSSKDFLAARKEAKNFFSVWMPYPLMKFGCGLWEDFSQKRHGQLPAVFNRRRCAAEWGGNTFSNEKLHKLLGWSPKIKTVDAVKLFLAQYK